MKIVVNYKGREKRFAMIENSHVEKLVIEQPKHKSTVHNIYLGIVTKVLPGMNAAFVQIGEERQGYLPFNRLPSFFAENNKSGNPSLIRQGEKWLVQVEKDSTGTKGPRLTARLEFNGKWVVYMPNGGYLAVSKKMDEKDKEKWRRVGGNIINDGEGLLFRTACMHATEEEVIEEIEQLRMQYRELKKFANTMKKPGLVEERDLFLKEVIEEWQRTEEGVLIVDDEQIARKLEPFRTEKKEIVLYREKGNIFTHFQIEGEIERAIKRIVWLENGAYLIFDETEALTIVDVNTGKYTGKTTLQETALKTNELAAKEIARQLRLRNIGGMILIDFIEMNGKEEQRKILKVMEQSLQKDQKRTTIVGFTSLGILQLTRKKNRISLSEGLTTKCSVCNGTGRVMSAESIAFQLERELFSYYGTDHEAVLIETTEEVAKVFAGEEDTVKEKLEKMIGMKIYFFIVYEPKPYYFIRQFGTIEGITKRLKSLRKQWEN